MGLRGRGVGVCVCVHAGPCSRQWDTEGNYGFKPAGWNQLSHANFLTPICLFFLNPILKKKKKKCINLLQLSSAQSTNVSEDFKKTYFVSIVYP